VEQAGAPAEVHGQPASPFVARFLGLNNLLPGRVSRLDPLQAETALGVFQGAWAAPGQPEVGKAVTLLLRPRGAAFLPVDGRVNRLRGVVEDSVFRADGYTLNLRASNGQEFSFSVDRPFPVGKEIEVAVEASAVQFLKEEK
jgi:ABC-type Fe3+/spermidine/putrescine transport system ATPase subunit